MLGPPLRVQSRDGSPSGPIVSLVERVGALLFVAGRELPPFKRTSLRFAVNKPRVEEQKELWEEVLGAAGAHLNGSLDSVAAQFRLSAQRIHAIGSALRAAYRGKYRLRLTDIAPLGEAAPGEELVQADIGDAAACDAMMQGVDCVVHLGGRAIEDAWEVILPANIVGCYNVFEAARRAGVKRVVFASSNHAVGFHRREHFIDDQVQPQVHSTVAIDCRVLHRQLAKLWTCGSRK